MFPEKELVQENEMNRILKYVDKKSEHELFLKRKQIDLKEKAQYHWALLRESVSSAMKAVEGANQRELEINHGIHIQRKLTHLQQISQVLYIPEHKEYWTCDGHNFYCFHEDGQKKGTAPVMENINRVSYSSQTNQFVGWVHGQEDLYLMSRDLVIRSQSRAVGRILLSAYNHNTGELITVGPHFITSWIFRYGARYLIPRKTTSTNFGETNMFKTMVLEESSSQTQRIFFPYENGVVVFCAYSGTDISHRKELHAQPVTALTFFNTLKYVITGARDGCIKVWDVDWKIKMVFVGHSDQVNFLQIYPHGPAFVSASLDCTLRVWNMDTCDEMDRTVISEPIEGMDIQKNYEIFYTYAGKTVDLWKLEHLFHLHTRIGYQVYNIKVTSHPLFPQRAILLCRDSSIRIVCPANGEVITTLLIKKTEDLNDATYAIAEDTIFAVTSSGDIVKSITHKNPCEIVSQWKCINPREICNCLLVYEYVADSLGSSDVWSLTNCQVQTSKKHTIGTQKNKNRTLLLGGRKDGYICVFDWYTGEVTFKAEAHCSKGVISMIANTRADQLISAGFDNVIKVWRLYPYAQEALTPLMAFYCAHRPAFMTAISMRLCVAFQDPSTATFNVVLYSLSDKRRSQWQCTNSVVPARVWSHCNLEDDRFDHKPDDDHIDLITGLTSCPRMKIYASSSVDGTICIWSENNILLRLLRLKTAIHSIAFCSPQGDLLVGIDSHLYHIPHSKFLPKSYKRKQVCMKFLPVKFEKPLKYDENLHNVMQKSDVQRLKNAHASFKHTPDSFVLPPEEQIQERAVKEEAYRSLELRENEITLIRDGALKAQHKRKPTKRTEDIAFIEYMKMYFIKKREKILLDDDYYEDALQKKLAGVSFPQNEEKYRPEEAPLSFFSEIGEKYMKEDSQSVLHHCYPSAITGFLPNSVLIKILHPPSVPKEVPWEAISYKPPKLTSRQLAEISSLYKKLGTAQDFEDDMELSNTVTSPDEDCLSHTIEMDFTVNNEDKQNSDKHTILPGKSLRKKLDPTVSKIDTKAQHANRKRNVIKAYMDNDDAEDSDAIESHPGLSQKLSLMSKFQGIINKPSPEIDDIKDVPKTPPSKTFKHPSSSLVKPVTKLISKSEIKNLAITSLRQTSPSLSTTSLPNFIKQFVMTDWFHKYFPNCNENTMPKPWTSDTFINMISKLLQIADWIDRVNVADAILCVYNEKGLNESVTLSVVRILTAVLNHQSLPPVCSVIEQKAFIMSALKILAAFLVKDKEVITEMMVQFLVGDMDVRSSVLDALANLGLVDPHRQFQKELDSWDIWSIDECNLRNEIHNVCTQWLERWMTTYKMRIKDSIHLLNKGHSLQGHIKSVSGQLRKGSVKQSEREHDSSTHGTPQTGHPNSVRKGQMSPISLTVTLDNLHSQSILETVNYLEAVTYFCEIMMEKELAALKVGKVSRGHLGERVAQAKNTVLVLPRISKKPALVRLGEMHTSQCRPERETTQHTDFYIPPAAVRGRHAAYGDLGSFVSYINLPMKTVYLNPFISASDKSDSCNDKPVLITLKLSQKYFIPSKSYVPREDNVALGS